MRVVKMVGMAIAVLFLLPMATYAKYVGVKRCQPCHLVQAKSWQQTKMAQAFELLKPGVAAQSKRAHKLDPDKDYTHDADCLPCHVTGYGKPGGFVSVDLTPTLVGVQCEQCHGPGAGYLKPNLMSLQNKEYKLAEVVAAGLILPEAKTCESCHNEKNPFHKPFDFKSQRNQGTHQHFPLKYSHE